MGSRGNLNMNNNKVLLTKIGNIQAEIDDLIKDERNKHQNYKYFNEAELLKILKPQLKEKKLTIEITDDDTQPFIYQREACGDNVNFAQVKGSAETYAMKYILSKFFLIRSLDENDPDLKDDKENNSDKSKTINPAEAEKKIIMERVILRNENKPNLKLSELKEAILKHGDLDI
ncbi:15798_t:CDS:2 [Funneliformis geosporum]|nr:15798_t:CDS:2 [Funneliformis geosporum]